MNWFTKLFTAPKAPEETHMWEYESYAPDSKEFYPLQSFGKFDVIQKPVREPPPMREVTKGWATMKEQPLYYDHKTWIVVSVKDSYWTTVAIRIAENFSLETGLSLMVNSTNLIELGHSSICCVVEIRSGQRYTQRQVKDLAKRLKKGLYSDYVKIEYSDGTSEFYE